MWLEDSYRFTILFKSKLTLVTPEVKRAQARAQEITLTVAHVLDLVHRLWFDYLSLNISSFLFSLCGLMVYV